MEGGGGEVESGGWGVCGGEGIEGWRCFFFVAEEGVGIPRVALNRQCDVWL